MHGRRLNILLVDDDAPLLEVYAQLLIEAGFDVHATGDGFSALESARKAIFDVAVVDYDMPPPDGLEVLARLRTMQPNCVRMLVSGDLDVPGVMDAVNRGEAARILAKPFEAAKLIATIEDAIEMRERLGEQFISARQARNSEEDAILRECFSTNYFRLALQPIVRADDRSTFAYEALLRCTHPKLSGAAAVIAAAERQGRLTQLGAAVVAQAAALVEALTPPMKLFVNLHPTELEDPHGLLERLDPLKRRAHRIVLEITERSKMINANHWRDSTARLVEAGFTIALDDLGAGYSSLSMLAELKPQIVKLDMSIIRNCDTDTHKRRLLELVCKFGAATGATVLGEGIETEAEAKTVIECGAQLLQGYLFGRPQDQK